MIGKHIEDFLRKWAKTGRPEIYNEFSFQFELGGYLRKKLPKYKVQFERNISDFFIDEKNYQNRNNLVKDNETIKYKFYKKEIDIVVFEGDNPWGATEKYAIELKYIMPSDPTTDKMHEMLEDVAFTAQLRDQNNFENVSIVGNDQKIKSITKQSFCHTYAVTLTNRNDFYECRKGWKGDKQDLESTGAESRYYVFRTEGTGKNGISCAGGKYEKGGKLARDVPSFTSKWQDLQNDFRYYMVEW
ncbi:MAG: hypothetical protein IJZ73_02415 [Clostridia bacterium]|nr:hypothetical protein [Clostridia bacterium]